MIIMLKFKRKENKKNISNGFLGKTFGEKKKIHTRSYHK